jgi:transposase
MKNTEKEYFVRREAAAQNAIRDISEREAAFKFKVTRGIVTYWKKKVQLPSFHTFKHGGFRYTKQNIMVNAVLYCLAKLYRNSTLSEFKQALIIITKKSYSVSTISRIFKKWGWTYHVVDYKQKLKYVPVNVHRYFQHTVFISELAAKEGIKVIKYLDEVHFTSRQLNRRKGIGVKGRRIVVSSDVRLSETYSMTLMTTPYRDIPFVSS